VIAVLTGASSEEQIAANARAASWKLSEGELAEIREILEAG
jgi:aryl-alcohol dehydrogenase-like predicted oxidoreductase